MSLQNKKILIIARPGMKNFYQKFFKYLGSKIEIIDENYSKFKKKILESTAVVRIPTHFIKSEIFNYTKKLDWIHYGGAGLEDVLIPELVESNITLTNGKILQGPEIADHAIALCLALTRKIKFSILQKPIVFRPIELKEKKVLIYGVGGVGALIAERIKTFSCHIIGIDNELKPLHSFIDEFYRPNKLMNVLHKVDIIFICSPLTAKTKTLFGSKEFKKIKKNSYLINVSRGKTVETKSLIKAIKSKKLSGAGLDVTDPEPLNKNHILRKLDNVIITPHNAGLSEMNRERSMELMKENIERYLKNNSLLNEVDKTKGY